jgi:hypothetical protein
MCPGSARLLRKPSSVKSAQTSPGSETHQPLHPGWGYVRRKRLAAARSCLPKVAVSEAESQPPSAWALNLFTMLKIIWVSSSAELCDGSESPKPSQRQHTNLPESYFIPDHQAGLQRERIPNIGRADPAPRGNPPSQASRPTRIPRRCSRERLIVPWESGCRQSSG